jgi:SH3 domain-containing protein
MLGAVLFGGAGVRPVYSAGREPAARVAVPEGDTFMLTVSSAYVREAPAPDAERLFSVFVGQMLAVLDSSDDGVWLQVSSGDAAGWIRASYGMVGDAQTLRLPAQTAVVRPVPAGVVPLVSERAIEIYRRGQRLGNRSSVFAKVGDCNTENGRFLAMFEEPGSYQLGPRFNFLQSTIDNFGGSFGRTSLAAVSGFSPAAVLSAVWADPEVCEAGEGPLQCEYRLMRPSFALIALGTHYGPNLREFEDGLRQVIDESIELGVVPILATKADDLEGQGRVNEIIRRLANEYDLPLWDFWLAAQPLPADGLADDGIHLTYGRSNFADPWAMSRGWTWRNLTALLALEAVWHGVAGAAEEKTLARR